MSCMALNEYLNNNYHNEHHFSLGVIAADIVYNQIKKLRPNDEIISSSQALYFLLNQDISKIPDLLAWLIISYCQKINIYRYHENHKGEINYMQTFPPELLSYINEYPKIYEMAIKYKDLLEIPFPFSIDVLMCASNRISCGVNFQETTKENEHRMLKTVVVVYDTEENTYVRYGQGTLSYHRNY